MKDAERTTLPGRASVRDSSGQVAVLLAVFMTVIIGAVGMVLDVGSWYQVDRATQATADAAALAGAQKLIAGTGDATLLAEEYAGKNGGGELGISFGTRLRPNDLITVTVERPAQAFFTKVLGIDSVEVRARATARAGVPGRARYVAPITVNEQHPMLQCGCFGEPTEVNLLNLHNPGGSDAAGAFGLLNLESLSNPSGNIGSDVLAQWIRDGYEDELPLGDYDSAPSANFNSDYIRNALRDRIGDELLFPVYRTITGGGSVAKFEIIGWVGFVPTSFTAGGSSGTVSGHFTQVVWQGLADETGTVPDFGVRVITLVE
jgi:hypothetical protein